MQMKKKILIVDDSAYIRNNIKQTLKKARLNIEIIEAQNGYDALKILKK